MEISYRREAKHNYLVAGQMEENAGYAARMLAGNEIRGLLRMHIRYQDGWPLYCYDITSRQPFGRLLETRFITRDEICQLLIQMHATLTEMEEYLLDGGSILLDPEYIYVEPELFQTGLCLVPGLHGDFQEKLSRLLQYILKRVNHKDKECVVLAYGLYQESLKENCGMEDLLALIAVEQQKAVETRGKEDTQKHQEERTAVYEPTEPDDKPGEVKRSAEGQQGIALGRQAVLWLMAAVVLPAALWLFRGRGVVLGLRKVFIIMDVGLFLILAAVDIWKLRRRAETCVNEDESPWRILYEDEEEEIQPYRPEEGTAGVQEHSQDGMEENFQTVLLSDRSAEGDGLHRLTSLDGSEEDIIITYYPFVIGKHRDLADYVLPRDTVSRFHLRIDTDDGHYTITDLNSTNGTRVRGQLLEANETVDLEPGDQVHIADLGYIFN